MGHVARHVLAPLAFLTIATSPLACQPDTERTVDTGRSLDTERTVDTTLDTERTLDAARTLIASAPFVSLATVDDRGYPSVRLMDAAAPDSAFVVWLATNPASRKVTQLRSDGRVALHWTDAEGPGYVTLIGRARLVDDPTEKRAHWQPSWDPFYAGGATDALLIEVTPIRLEVISIPAGLEGDPDTWRADLVEFEGRSGGR